MKRAFDVVAAGSCLAFLSPVFVLVALLIKLDSPGPVFFRQERVGRFFTSFFIWKFRTMVPDADKRGGLLTSSGDARITRVGKYLRKVKLDELPQLWNVLVGDMSLVGPRPEVQKFVSLFKHDYERILTVRPGITDLASLAYRNEEEILARSAEPEKLYIDTVLPVKLRLSLEYVERRGFWFDLCLIGRTIVAILGRL
jgi:lipopolysaccharide/colanic/teichoic acid biosynthesis glycosyltransferase